MGLRTLTFHIEAHCARAGDAMPTPTERVAKYLQRPSGALKQATAHVRIIFLWGDAMFVVVISFPQIKAGKDAEFQEWFAGTNEEFSRFKGFIRRRLLKPLGDGTYGAIVEFENQDAFKSTQSSPEHAAAGERVKPLLNGNPTPHFYEVIIG